MLWVIKVKETERIRVGSDRERSQEHTWSYCVKADDAETAISELIRSIRSWHEGDPNSIDIEVQELTKLNASDRWIHEGFAPSKE